MPRNYLEERLSHTEQTLSGGNSNVVSRVGETVRRRRDTSSDGVYALLDFLESSGFKASPKFLGLDSLNREVLSYMHGDVGNYPLTSDVRSEGALITSAQLLRKFHDTTAPLAHRGLNFAHNYCSPDVAETICHGDFGPYNLVFDGITPVGIIDFD